MSGFSSGGEPLGPPKSGEWTRERGGVEGGERKEGACLDPGVGGWERGGAGGRGSFKQLKRGSSCLGERRRDFSLVLSITWHNSFTVTLRIYLRTGWEEEKGFTKTAIIM